MVFESPPVHMKLIKTITKDNKTLNHWHYQDDLGFFQESFEIIKTDEKGYRTVIPFIGFPKVQVYDGLIKGNAEFYTDDEYQKMLDEVA